MIASLQALAPFVPVTVVGAIFLFIIKEAVEFRRRRGADRRKIHAIKHFIARDLELCHWAINTYRNVLHGIQRVEEESGRQMRIFTEPSGRLRFEHWGNEDDSSFRSGGMIAPVVNTFASRFMLELATLDRNLYKEVENTTDSLAELEHVRASIIEHVAKPIHRDGFIEYARRELVDIETSIKDLYRICTGNDEIIRRIR